MVKLPLEEGKGINSHPTKVIHFSTKETINSSFHQPTFKVINKNVHLHQWPRIMFSKTSPTYRTPHATVGYIKKRTNILTAGEAAWPQSRGHHTICYRLFPTASLRARLLLLRSEPWLVLTAGSWAGGGCAAAAGCAWGCCTAATAGFCCKAAC